MGVGGRVPALHHEVRGQVSRAAARRVDPSKFHEVFVVSVRLLRASLAPSLAPTNPGPSTDCPPARGDGQPQFPTVVRVEQRASEQDPLGTLECCAHDRPVPDVTAVTLPFLP